MPRIYEGKITTLAAEHKTKLKENEDLVKRNVQRKTLIKKADEKMFRFKERGKSAKHLTANNCDNPECTSVNIDLIFCMYRI